MPPTRRPTPLYGWLCVVHSAAEILGHAARIRAEQAAQATSYLRQRPFSRKGVDRSPNVESYDVDKHAQAAVELQSDERYKGTVLPSAIEKSNITRGIPEVIVEPPLRDVETHQNVVQPTEVLQLPSSNFSSSDDSHIEKTTREEPIPQFMTSANPQQAVQRTLQASRVPSSRIGRLFHYGGLAAGLGYGAAAEVLRRTGGGGTSENVVMTPANVKRLVDKLSRMRGAALKVGQFLSIQDTHVLPKDVEEVFRRVQDSAHYMPHSQLQEVLSSSLGASWNSYFTEFSPIPFAAASLGQVHSGILAAEFSPTGQQEEVAIKVQFPNISRSIESDLGYLTWILSLGRVLPKGLFLDKTIQVMKQELQDECDYTKEAAAARFFGSSEGLADDLRYRVPWIWEHSTEKVLVMQKMDGISVGSALVESLEQRDRDEIAGRVLELCLKELFDFRMMQTDPNWSNFFWNGKTRQIELIDFGATRSYSKDFMDRWFHLLRAAIAEDFDACIEWSEKLGYLTGAESDAMRTAHVKSVTLLATPFRSSRQPYEFGKETEWTSITAEIRSLIPVMLQERLTPPPRETYSLNRKLSGAFLLASRLNAKIDAAQIWSFAASRYTFDS